MVSVVGGDSAGVAAAALEAVRSRIEVALTFRFGEKTYAAEACGGSLDHSLSAIEVPPGAASEQILAWDFDRIVVAHGDVLERNGRERLRAAYSWLLAE